MNLFVKLFLVYQFKFIFVSSSLSVDVQLCSSYPKLNSLPGNGWCSLRNIEMNPIFSVTYEKCQVLETPTGKYLIPDYLHIIPKSKSDVDTTQELIDHYQNFTSITAASMSASASGGYGKFSAEATFSSDYQNMKKNQVINKSVTSRVTGRYVLHAATFDEYAVELHPDLKAKLQDAIEAITAGNLNKASLILELAVLSHGTHAITAIDLGGVVVKEDYISESYVRGDDMDKLALGASASIGYASFFNAKTSFNTDKYKDQYDEYVKHIKSTKIGSHGGELFKSATNISSWVDSLPNNLVAVDRSGVALPYVITPRHFPNVNQTTLAALRREYVEAIEDFNAINIRVGCMNQNSPNFDYNANIGDKSCHDPPTNYSLGGFFQTCYCDGGRECDQCEDYVVKNFLTGDTTCPDMYSPVYLSGKSLPYCWKSCYPWYIFWTKCDRHCFDYEYKAYWCAANHYPIPQNTGLMFGGVFMDAAKNPVTGSKNCPPNFMQVDIMKHLHVCVSADYELGFKYSVPFGGFFTGTEGNPLAAISLKNKKTATLKLQSAKSTCGVGYSQHTAGIVNNVMIFYCVKANSFGSGQKELPIVLPPFQNYDDMFAEEEALMISVIPVVHESPITIIVLGTLLGFVISGILCFIAWKKCTGRTTNDAGRSERTALITDNEPVAAGYQTISEA